VEQGLRLLSANPAAMTGLDKTAIDGAGCLRAGGPADLVAVDVDGKLLGSILRGHLMRT